VTAQEVLDSIEDHIAVLDAQGTILMVNEAWRSFADENGSEQLARSSVGLNYLGVLDKTGGRSPGGEPAGVARGIRAVLAGHLPEYHCDYPCESKEGLRWFRMRVTPVGITGLLDHHEVGAVVLAAQDITGRIDREAERSRGQALLDRIGELAKVGGAELDLRSGQVFWTAEMCRILEVEPDQIPHPSLWERFFEGDALATYRSVVIEMNTKGTPIDYETPMVTAKGRRIWVRIRSTAELSDGKVVRLTSAHQDITERKVAEQERALLVEQFREAQKLESLGSLAGGIAHDFNNILAVILFAVEALQQAQGNQRPDAVPELAREIGDAAIRARDLTKQLLAFARKQPIAPVALDLDAAVRSSERLLRRLLGEAIKLEDRLDAAAWMVRCDPSQLEQLLLNLSVNARDAMPRGGTLTFATSRLAAGDPALIGYGELPAGDWVQLSIADTGTGMTPEVQARMFEPFFTTKPVGKGTGLGLATVHGIVKQSGGAIRCESQPGVGTTFYICLPRAAAVTPATGPDLSVPRRKHFSERILLVEDDPHVRRAAIRALEAGGFRVLVAKDGLSALQVASAADGELDLVISDVVMPGLDGGGLAAELSARWPDLPILFVSGYPDDAISDHGVLREGVEFLAKPFTGEELIARTRKVLDARYL
jgi:PAS domain S-box-containing protein